MTRKEIFSYVKEKYSVEPEFPWDGETHAVLRHPLSQKWFALLMDVKKKTLGLGDENTGEEFESVMNVKASPLVIEDLLHEDAFLPGWHMNKKYWVTIRLNLVSPSAVKKLLDASWDLVKPKTSPRKRD